MRRVYAYRGPVARLTTQQRNALPDSAFAIPESREYPYRGLPGGPKTNRAHAIDALARVSASGTDEKKRRVAMAVNSEYPDMRGKLRQMTERS
jgi:hypothetical protein